MTCPLFFPNGNECAYKSTFNRKLYLPASIVTWISRVLDIAGIVSTTDILPYTRLENEAFLLTTASRIILCIVVAQ